MSNAKQRAIDALGATFSAIEGINREEAFQSATYVVEELIAAMGPCRVDKCCKMDAARICHNPTPCIYHSARQVERFLGGLVEPLGCLETCYAGSCNYKDKLHPTCYAYAVCLERAEHPALQPCNELLQGYTLEQWGQIRSSGYLCQFSNVTNDGKPDWEKPVARLTSLGGRWEDNTPEVAFLSESGKGYAFCRPAQIPGVLRPWFGGDCPVDPDTQVFAIFRRPGAYIQKAGSLNWSHNRELHSNAEITAFMVIPE